MTDTKYIPFPDSIGQSAHEDLPQEHPSEETEIQVLLRKFRAGEMTFSTLTQEQKDFIKSITTKCPGCGIEFPLYDARQGKVRKACSQKCLGIIRTNRHWQCALCQKRLKNPVSLRMHIEAIHKEYTLHQYLVAYFKAMGKDSNSLTPFCPKCGGERKLNFPKQRYDNCQCQNAISKINRLKELLLKTTDDAERLIIQKQIAGCHRALSRRTGEKKPSKLNIQSTSLPASPPPPPVKSLVIIEPGYDFKGFALYVEGVLSSATPVFDAYYNLVQITRGSPSPASLGMANTSLHQLLQQQAWTTSLPSRPGYWAFIYAFAPDNSDFSLIHMVPYYKELPGDRTRMDEFYSKVKFDRAQVSQVLLDLKGNQLYPVPQHETYQAFYRLVETSMHDVPRLCFNPQVVWQLDQLYGVM